MAEVLSGQIAVTTAGTAVAGPDVDGEEFILKAHPSNTGLVFVGNDGAGDVSSATGIALSAGQDITVKVINLSRLMFDSAVSSEKICWIKTRV